MTKERDKKPNNITIPKEVRFLSRKDSQGLGLILMLIGIAITTNSMLKISGAFLIVIGAAVLVL